MLATSKQISLCRFLALIFTLQIVTKFLSFPFSTLFMYLKNPTFPWLSHGFLSSAEKTVCSLLIDVDSTFTLFNALDYFPFISFLFVFLQVETVLFPYYIRIFIPHYSSSCIKHFLSLSFHALLLSISIPTFISFIPMLTHLQKLVI
jgi:hypothetical protein